MPLLKLDFRAPNFTFLLKSGTIADSLAKMKECTKVVITSSQVSDRGLKLLLTLPNVTEIKIIGVNQITNIGFSEYLAAAKYLRKLSLRGCTNISAQGLKGISPSDWGLSSVKLRGLSFNDEELGELFSRLTRVDTMTLANLHGMTGKGIEGLHHCKALSDLKLDSIPVSHQGMRTLKSLGNLGYLDLRKLNGISEETLAASLKGLHLRLLKIEHLPTGKLVMKAIGKLSTLHTLQLISSKEIDFSGLKGFQGLDYLEVTGPKVSELDALNNCPKLENVMIIKSQIDRTHVRDLLRCSTLESFEFKGCHVGNILASDFTAHSEKLTSVTFYDCSGVSKTLVQAIGNETTLEVGLCDKGYCQVWNYPYY